MKLDKVKHLWQYDQSIKEDWRNRSCTVASLTMILDYFGKTFKVQEVIEQGLLLKNAYIEGIGWDHRAMVSLAHNNGVQAYNQEFKTLSGDEVSIYDNEFIDFGIKKIEENINKNLPVMTSIFKDFDKNNGPHTIVIVGFDDDNFIYHDPKFENGAFMSVSRDVFIQNWRRLCVFFEN